MEKYIALMALEGIAVNEVSWIEKDIYHIWNLKNEINNNNNNDNNRSKLIYTETILRAAREEGHWWHGEKRRGD